MALTVTKNSHLSVVFEATQIADNGLSPVDLPLFGTDQFAVPYNLTSGLPSPLPMAILAANIRAKIYSATANTSIKFFRVELYDRGREDYGMRANIQDAAGGVGTNGTMVVMLERKHSFTQ